MYSLFAGSHFSPEGRTAMRSIPLALALSQPTSKTSHRQGPQLALGFLALWGLLGYPSPFMSAAIAQEQPDRSEGSEAPRSAQEAVPVEVKDMVVTRAGVAITLVSDQTQQELHLMIGAVEGQAIVRALRHARVPRPQTHDLMKTLLERDGWRVARVIIRDLSNGTYYADIVMERPGEFEIPGNVEERIVDARPSDAMALGLRFDAPIFVRQKVFDQERESREQDMQEKLEEQETLTI